jgi:phage tail sheath protein FI
MPGTVVTTATRSGPTTPLRAASGQYFVAGLTERGDTAAPILLRGMADYDRYCGARVTYGSLYDDLKTFFEEGGSQAYVARVVGGSASKGTLTLNDRAGSPLPSVRIDAQSAGSWSTSVTVEVQNGSVANTYRIIVRLAGEIVQDETNLSSPDDAVLRFSQSPYIRAVNLGSATGSPNNNPAVLAATALSAGNDQRASVVAADYVTALSRFTQGLGDGAVAIPGQGTAVHAGLILHAKDNRRIALLATIRNETVANLTALASTYTSEYAALIAPWILVSDGANGVRAISPEGYVAACRSRAHDSIGPARAPAGDIAKARTILGVDQSFTRAEGDTLDNGKVSAIRVIANTVRLYGWRSLSNDSANYYLLTGRDLLNRLVVSAELVLEEFVFQPIDAKGQLLSSINAALVGIVEPMRKLGMLYENYDDAGNLIDPGYKVETGSEVNSAASLAANEVRARLSVRVSPSGALVSLTIVKVAVTGGL